MRKVKVGGSTVGKRYGMSHSTGRMRSGVSNKTDAINRRFSKSSDAKMGIDTKLNKRFGLKAKSRDVRMGIVKNSLRMSRPKKAY